MTGATISRRRLGIEVRRLREARSLRLEDIAAHLGVAPSTLSRIETGQAPARTSYLALMLDIYGVDDPAERRRLTDLAREGQRKDWWTQYADLLPHGAGMYFGLEAAASQIRSYAVQAVPGLLRTEDYAAAVCRAARPNLAADQVRKLVTITMRRQEILHRSGIRLHAIIDESALLRTITSPAIMSEQADHLAAMADLETVTVRVARLAQPRPALSPPFTLLSFADASPDIACYHGPDNQVILAGRAAGIHAAQDAFTRLDQATRT